MLTHIGGIIEETVHLLVLMPASHQESVNSLLTLATGGSVTQLVLVVHIPHGAIGIEH